MKQIFDWLREQLNEHLNYCKEVRSHLEEDYVKKFGYGSRIDAYNRAIKYINEAEAKYESDCCEWKGFDNSLIEGKVMWTYETTCKKYIPEERTSTAFRYCPYCGKPIKILEVE